MAGYPGNWPPGCPPADAEDAYGTVYRVCREDPPAKSDFQSHAELGKKSGGNNCMRHGLSVFRDLTEARHLTRIFPKLGSLVFRGELTADHGKVRQTPAKTRPSHTTWWPYQEIDRSAPFQLEIEG